MKTNSVQQLAATEGTTNRHVAGATPAAVLTSPGARPTIPAKWSWHYRTLLTLRRHLTQHTTEKLHDVAEPIEPHSLHAADSATDEFDHDLALALLAVETNALTEVDDAIARIVSGRYGRCEQTGAQIPADRLRAIPWCRYTREVEAQLEKQGTIRRAKIPDAVSLRGLQADIPGTGAVSTEGIDGGAPDETAPEEKLGRHPSEAIPDETALVELNETTSRDSAAL